MPLQYKKTLNYLWSLKRNSSVICLAAAALCMSSVGAIAETKRSIIFGIVPQQSATRLAQIWTPFLQELGANADLDIQFATAKDIPTFEACLEKGVFDVAYMNPYHYTVFHEVSGYEAFAKVAKKKLKGVIVAPLDSTLSRLDDLDNKKLAFPSPAAFGASVLPRAEMRMKGIEFTQDYVKSHDSVYRSVALGLYDAGGGVQRTFNNIPENLRAQLKIIHTTHAYTAHAFAFGTSISQHEKSVIEKAMLEFDNKELMQNIGMNGFEKAHNATWNDVRDLGIKQAVGSSNDGEGALCHLG